MDRRAFLGTAFLGALGLAGCTGGGDGAAPTPTEAPPATPSPTPTASPRPTPTPSPPTTQDESTPTPTGSPTPSPTPTPTPVDADAIIDVGPGGRLRFEPKTFEITAGQTVLWEFRSGGHNVKPSSVPRRSDWSGTPGEEFDTFSSGHRYTFTFETPGEYKYYCAPHRSAGMVGSFTVR